MIRNTKIKVYLPNFYSPEMTCEAPSNLSLSLSPTSLKDGSRIQQVLIAQLPDIPWHLHPFFISLDTCYKDLIFFIWKCCVIHKYVLIAIFGSEVKSCLLNLLLYEGKYNPKRWLQFNVIFTRAQCKNFNCNIDYKL